MPVLGMSISPRSTEPGSAFFEASPASQTEPLTHPHPAKIHVEQSPPCSKNRVGKFFSSKANLHLVDELPTQTLQGKIRLALAETASEDSIYADGNPISLSDPFELCPIRVSLRPGCLILRGISEFACPLRHASGRDRR